jgi:hypothetical protein
MKHVWMAKGSVRGLLASLAIVCGVTLTAWSAPPTAAQAGSPRMMGGEWNVGIAPGEALRVIGVSNPVSRGRTAARMSFVIVDAHGSELFRSRGIEVQGGAMAFTDVAWQDLAATGDPVTGRVQARVIFEVALPAGSKRGHFVPLAEVFDLATGRTSQRTGPTIDVLYSAAGNSADYPY